MKWLGIGLMMAATVAGLIAWFVYENWPVVIGAVVFFFIGLLVFLRGEPKTTARIEKIHTDKKEDE
jgi:L-lactate permease